MNQIINFAKQLNAKGIYTVPCNGKKEPICRGANGETYHLSIVKKGFDKAQTVKDIENVFPTDCELFGIIAGANLVILDFDIKNCPSYAANGCNGRKASATGTDIFTRFVDACLAKGIDLQDLYIEQTMSGGYHIVYKIENKPTDKTLAKYYQNTHLAKIVRVCDYGVTLRNDFANFADYLAANPHTAKIDITGVLPAALVELYTEFNAKLDRFGIKGQFLNRVTPSQWLDLFIGEIAQRIEKRGHDLEAIVDETIDKIVKTNEDLSLVMGDAFDYILATLTALPQLSEVFGAAIETRVSHNSYAVVAPSKGYEVKNGDLFDLPTLDDAQHRELFDIAMSFNSDLRVRKMPNPTTFKPTANHDNQEKAGDAYNAQNGIAYEVLGLLTKNGWQELDTKGENIVLRRPNKNDGQSAMLRISDGCLYVFSTSTEFEANVGLSPFYVYTKLEHNGNYKESAKAIAQKLGIEYKSQKTGLNAPKLPSLTIEPQNEKGDELDGKECERGTDTVTLSKSDLEKYIRETVAYQIQQVKPTRKAPTALKTVDVTDTEFNQILTDSSIKFDFDHTYTPANAVFTANINGSSFKVATMGALVSVTGKSKAGKSNVCNCIMSSALSGRNTLNFNLQLGSKKVIYFDTEQSTDLVAYNIKEKIFRYSHLTIEQFKNRFNAYMLASMEVDKRLAFIEKTLERETNAGNEVGLVLIDGIRDLMRDVNDNAESDELTSRLIMLISKYNCILVTVIHTSETNNLMQGHLGRAIGRKCVHTIEVLREDSESRTRQIKSRNSRLGMEFPTFEFFINDYNHPVLSDDFQLPTDTFNTAIEQYGQSDNFF